MVPNLSKSETKNSVPTHGAYYIDYQSNTPSTENHTYTYAKAFIVVIAPQNLESSPMIFILKNVDTPTQRICASWCQTSLGVETIEDESHVLYVCDLHSKQRSKQVKNLSRIPLIIEMSTESTDPSNNNETNLKDYLMEILSPYSTVSVIPQNHQSLHIHCHRSLNIQPNTPQYIQFQERRSYAVNCACTSTILLSIWLEARELFIIKALMLTMALFSSLL